MQAKDLVMVFKIIKLFFIIPLWAPLGEVLLNVLLGAIMMKLFCHVKMETSIVLTDLNMVLSQRVLILLASYTATSLSLLSAMNLTVRILRNITIQNVMKKILVH